MKCSLCRTNEATIHIRNDINGAVTETHLCSSCAAQKGMSSSTAGPAPLMMDVPFEIAAHPENLIAQLMKQFPGPTAGSPGAETAATGSPGAKPPPAGLTGEALEAMEHLTHTGRFRRAEDYGLLEVFLGPMLQEIQAGRQHRGKAPSAAHIPRQTHLLELKQLLANAIAGEDYEQAAALRDQIHALESRNVSGVGEKA
ncbi:MAG: UvrB/UvrC motif-containing protein [Planctomycetota bacterium]